MHRLRTASLRVNQVVALEDWHTRVVVGK